MKENGEMLVSYKILAREGVPKLPGDEKEVLAFLGELYNDMLDSNITIFLGEQILAKWRKEIEEGIRELNNYNDFARANLPSNVPFSETECTLDMASKLIYFEKVDMSMLKLPAKKTKKEKGCEHSTNSINNIRLLDPVQVSSFLPGVMLEKVNDQSDESDNSNST
jgi:hypothetical protein